MDASIGAYQQLGGTILRYTILPTLLCLAAVVFLTGYVLPSSGVTKDASNTGVQVGEAVGLLALALFAGAPLFLIGMSYTSAFVTGLVSDYMVGALLDPAATAARAVRLVPKMLALTLYELLLAAGFLIVSGLMFMTSALIDSSSQGSALSPVVTIFGVLAFFIGLITFPFIVGRHALAVPIAYIEGLGPYQCAKRSIKLLKGRGYQPAGYGTVLALIVNCFLLTFFLWLGISTGFSILGVEVSIESLTAGTSYRDVLQQVAGYLPAFLVLWTIIPMWSATATILYYERRTRLEGYDIETLAQDVYRHAKTSRFEL